MAANDNQNLLISYLTMRKAVGWLGMLLPFILLAGNYILNSTEIFNNDWFFKIDENNRYESLNSFKCSVSHYYYTTVGEVLPVCYAQLHFLCFVIKDIRYAKEMQVSPTAHDKPRMFFRTWCCALPNIIRRFN